MSSKEMTSRRQAVMTSAAKLFAAHGFHGVTVDDIGAALDVSGPALYHHFASKEDLLGEMLLSVSEELRIVGKEATKDEPSDKLHRLIVAQVTFALERPELIIVHHRDLVHAPQSVQRRVRRLQREYVEFWVDALCALAPADRYEARAAVHAVIGLINSTPYSVRIRRDEMSKLLLTMATGALSAFVNDCWQR
jgi:AcrR family transcriptional regulator